VDPVVLYFAIVLALGLLTAFAYVWLRRSMLRRLGCAQPRLTGLGTVVLSLYTALLVAAFVIRQSYPETPLGVWLRGDGAPAKFVLGSLLALAAIEATFRLLGHATVRPHDHADG